MDINIISEDYTMYKDLIDEDKTTLSNNNTVKKYHILYKDKPEDYHSKGENITAIDEVDAIICFKANFPNVIFLALFSEELLNGIVNSTVNT